MSRLTRSVAVATPALVVVAAAWLRLEHPVVPIWRALALAGLALASAVPRRRSLRVVGAVVATVAAARLAVGVDLLPWRLSDPGSGFGLAPAFSAFGTRFSNGFSDFYGTHLPFDPRVHVAMGELVLSAVFGFSLAIALLVAARKPVAGALALLVGAGWPATLLGPSHGFAMGAAILGAALVLFAGLGPRRVPALALPAAAVVAAGAVLVGSATAARHGLVHWQSWNLAHVVTGSSVGVGFVWDAQYGGLEWPAHPTVVLQVESARAPSYLRAAVLDDFIGDAWSVGLPRPADAVEPAAAFRSRNETSEVVTVEGLADTRLVGGSIPIRFTAGSAPLFQPEPGFASLDQDLPRGFRYVALSYTPRPSAAELGRSAPDYPEAFVLDGLLDVRPGVPMPSFGAPHRFNSVLLQLAHNPGLNPYVPLARLAEEVAGRARTPYGAVARLQHWFLDSGGFRYSNRPLVIGPPLVGFVTQTRTGYCQYFAGAMALMLRYLGIPARVAVGFAGGTYDTHRHAWVVTDREAHAWVEVWFKGYGWIPFDPTPAAPGAAPRATRPGTGVGGPDVGPASGVGALKNAAGHASGAALTTKIPTQNGFFRRHARLGASPRTVSVGAGHGNFGDRSRPVLLLLLIVCAAGGAIVLAKAGLRVVRGARRDPRRVAAACREELASFLVDQRLEVPRSATLAELGDLVQHEFGAQAAPFVSSALAARFGPVEGSKAASVAARGELRALLGDARSGLTRGERLRGLFSLRSLVRPVSST